MCLVQIRRTVWEVVAIEDRFRNSAWTKVEGADPADTGAEQMRAMLEQVVPDSGPPLRNVRRCRKLNDFIYEFKTFGVRVLWFYDSGEPQMRKRIVCTHATNKLPKKKFQQVLGSATTAREEYLLAKSSGLLAEPRVRKKEEA